ncbi:hypothetical protein ACFLUA_05430 [Chloroflexota bacterium]
MALPLRQQSLSYNVAYLKSLGASQMWLFRLNQCVFYPLRDNSFAAGGQFSIAMLIWRRWGWSMQWVRPSLEGHNLLRRDIDHHQVLGEYDRHVTDLIVQLNVIYQPDFISPAIIDIVAGQHHPLCPAKSD